MSAQAEILTNKHDILKEKGTIADTLLVDHLFENFLRYASANWNYTATSGKQTAQDLLSTSGAKNVACGTLRTALKLLIENELKLVATGADINVRFITKPHLKCFDSKVTGNVCNPGATTYDLGCYFASHYFVKCGDKYYDPCLATTYSREDGPILARSTNVPNAGDTLVYLGTGRALILLHKLAGRSAPGFGSAYEALSVTRDNIKKRLTPHEYNAAKMCRVLLDAGLK